jgi:ADP-heptose:LPS heptosyltransferase
LTPHDDLTSTHAASALLPDLPHGAEVLLIRLRSLGDLVLETPAIRALHDWRPDLRISVLAEERFAAVFEGNPAISEVLISRGLTETALELRRRKFPTAFNQHGGPRSAMLTGASGAAHRVGWTGYQYSFLYNVHVPDAVEFYGGAPVHTVEHRISQLYFCGLPRGPIPATELFPQADAIASAMAKIRAKGIASAARYAVLQPGARLPGMRWPIENFAAVARWLRDAHQIASVVNVAERDEAVAVEAGAEFRDCAVIPSALDVRELIGLISGASLFVGNDSGPAHIASALGVPTVVIFSETDPAQWGPRSARSRVVSTGVTFRHPRGDKALLVTQARSIDAIREDEVRAACEDVLRP